MTHTPEAKRILRRRILKLTGVAGGIAVWKQPIVNHLVLPVHATTTQVENAQDAPMNVDEQASASNSTDSTPTTPDNGTPNNDTPANPQQEQSGKEQQSKSDAQEQQIKNQEQQTK